MESWLTPWRIKTYPRALGFAIVVAFVLLVLISAPTLFTPQGIPLGADYPVFHAAGQVVLEGRPEALFSVEAMQRAQAAALGREALEGYHAWVYPPYVAALYAPFSALPYLWSFLAYTVFLLGACWLAADQATKLEPRLASHKETVFLMLATFYPLLRASFGGQNSALSLALLMGAGAALSRGRDARAGLWLGLLLYKPHFGVLALFFAVVWGRWKVLGTAALCGVGWYALGALVAGWDWPLSWLSAVGAYRELEAEVNGATLISFLGVAEHLLGAGSKPAFVIGGVLSLAGVASTAWIGWRTQAFPVWWGLVAICLVLCSPHTQFYDMALVGVAGVVWVGRRGRSGAGVLLGFWAAACIHAAWPWTAFQPLFAVTLVLAGFWLREVIEG